MLLCQYIMNNATENCLVLHLRQLFPENFKSVHIFPVTFHQHMQVTYEIAESHSKQRMESGSSKSDLCQGWLPLPRVTLPLPKVTVPLPMVTLPLPMIILPLPMVTLPLPMIILPLPMVTLPLPKFWLMWCGFLNADRDPQSTKGKRSSLKGVHSPPPPHTPLIK